MRGRVPHASGDLVEVVHREVLARFAEQAEVHSSGSREEAPGVDAEVDRSSVVEIVRARAPLADAESVAALADAVLARMHGLGPLEPLVRDPAVTEVMVNGDGVVWLERAGTLVRPGVVLPAEEVHTLIERVVAPLGRRVDRTHPLVDARLADGSRVHAVVPPVAVDGPCLTIRRFGVHRRPLSAFCAPEVAALLAALVQARCSIVVSGGTGAGKTTLLNALAASIPSEERLVTVEDTAELRLDHPHVVRLESAELAGQTVDLPQLVRTSLRMRPDRIIVGEVRGPEVTAMLAAMSTGHEGSLSTCHANTPRDAIGRLETMALAAGTGMPLEAIRAQLRSAVHVVVQVARRGATRRVVAVHEVDPCPGPDGDVLTHALAEGERVVHSGCRAALGRSA